MRGCSVFTVFTSDHLCIDSIQCTLITWVVWSETRRKWWRHLWTASKAKDVNMVSQQKQTPFLRSWGPWKNLARPRHGAYGSLWWGKVFFFSKYCYCPISKLGILILLIFFWGQGGLERTLQARPRHIWINVGDNFPLSHQVSLRPGDVER